MDVVIDLVSKKMLLVISPNERELESSTSIICKKFFTINRLILILKRICGTS